MKEQENGMKPKWGKRGIPHRVAAAILVLVLLLSMLPAGVLAATTEKGSFYTAMGMGDEVDGGKILLYNASVSDVSKNPSEYTPCQELSPDTEDGALLLNKGDMTLTYAYTPTLARLEATNTTTQYKINVPEVLTFADSATTVPLNMTFTDNTKEYTYGELHVVDGSVWVTFDGVDRKDVLELLKDFEPGQAMIFLGCKLEFPPADGTVADDNRYEFNFEDNSALKFGYKDKESEVPAKLEKQGGKYNDDGTITWTVKYLPFQNTKKTGFAIEDVLDTNEQSFVADSVTTDPGYTIEPTVVDDEENHKQTVTFTVKDSEGNEVTDTADHIEFSFKTKVNSAVFIGDGGNMGNADTNAAKGEADITNSVDLKWTDQGTEPEDAISGESSAVKANHTWMTKSVGDVAGGAGHRTVTWTINIDTLGLDLGTDKTFTLKDTLPVGCIGLVANSMKLNNTLITPVVNDKTFTIAFDQNDLTDGKGKLTYTTSIDEDYYVNGTDLGKNLAELTFTYGDGDYTITVGKALGEGAGGAAGTGLLEKSGDYTMGTHTKDHTIVWTVKVNPNKADLTGVTLTDTLVGTTLVEEVKYTVDGAPLTLTDGWYRWNSTSKELNMTLGDIGTRIVTITIKAKVDEDKDYACNTNGKTYANSISMSYNTDKSTSATGSVTVSSNVVDKTVKTDDYIYNDPTADGKPTIKWHIEVNRNQMPMTTAKLTDTLPKGLTYLDDSLTTDAGTATASQTDNVLTIDLGDAAGGKTLNLTYKTTVDVEQIGNFETDEIVQIKNNVKLSFTSEGKSYDQTHSATIDVPNYGLSKYGELNKDTGVIEYTVGLNPNAVKLADSVITDNIPEGLRLIVDSVELHRATLPGENASAGDSDPEGFNIKFTKGDKIPLTLGNNLKYIPDTTTGEISYSGTFTIQLPENEASAYLLKYKCTIVGIGDGTFKNSIQFSGNFQKDSGGSDSSVGVTASAAASAAAARKKSYGVIEVTKKGAGGAFLEGVGFQLLDEGGNIVASGKTDADGKLTFDGLSTGKTYTLHESAPLLGYKQADDQQIKVEHNGNEGAYEATVENVLKTNGIEFIKTSESGVALPGAVFGLYTDAACTNAYTANGAALTATSGADGKVAFEKIPYSAEYYYFKETTPPTNYLLSHSVYKFKIQADGTPSDITLVGVDGGKITSIPNSADPEALVNLTVLKVDKSTAASANPRYLAGAEFTLYSDEACTVRVGAAKTTDANGKAVFEDLKWDTAYWLKETRAPAGYELNSTPIPVMARTGVTEEWTITAFNTYRSYPDPTPSETPNPTPEVPEEVTPEPTPEPTPPAAQLPNNGIQGDIPADDPNYIIDEDGVPHGIPPVADPDYWLDSHGVPLGYRNEAGEWVWIEDEEVPLGFVNPDHQWVDFVPQTGDETGWLPALFLVLGCALAGMTIYGCIKWQNERRGKRE